MIEWSKYIYILDVLGIPIHVILSGNNYLLEIVFEIKLIVNICPRLYYKNMQ